MKVYVKFNMRASIVDTILARFNSMSKVKPATDKDKYKSPLTLSVPMPPNTQMFSASSIHDAFDLITVEGNGVGSLKVPTKGDMQPDITLYALAKPAGIAVISVSETDEIVIYYMGEHFTLIEILKMFSITEDKITDICVVWYDRFTKQNNITAQELLTPVSNTAKNNWLAGNSDILSRMVEEYINLPIDSIGKPCHPELIKAWDFFKENYPQLAEKYEETRIQLQSLAQASGRHKALINTMVKVTPN